MATTATATPIKGNDIFFTLGNKKVYHATSHQLSLSNDYEEYETKNTQGKVQVLSGNTGTAQCESMVCVLGSTSEDMDTGDLIHAWKDGTELSLALTIGDIVYTAPAWIESVSLSAPVAQRATCSVSFKLGELNLGPKS